MVNFPKSMHEICVRLTMQAIFYCLYVRDVRSMATSLESTIVVLLSKSVKPGCGNASNIVYASSDSLVTSTCALIFWDAPHMSNPTRLCTQNFATTQPSAQRLIKILTSPSSHFVI